MRHLLIATLTWLVFTNTALATQPMSFDAAVSKLASAQTDAEQCTGLYKRYVPPMSMAFKTARSSYASAKSRMDGVIDGLIVGFRRNPTAKQTPDDLTTQFHSAMQALKSYCERAQAYLPDADGNQRNLGRGLVFVLEVLNAVGSVVTGINFMQNNVITEADRNAVIETLESRRWPDFERVPPAP